MRIHVAEAIWLDEKGVCSIEQLSELSGLSTDEINELVESGVIEPLDQVAQTKSFQQSYARVARTARKLRDDFELDRPGLALTMTLLRRIEELQGELAETQVRIKRVIQ